MSKPKKKSNQEAELEDQQAEVETQVELVVAEATEFEVDLVSDTDVHAEQKSVEVIEDVDLVKPAEQQAVEELPKSKINKMRIMGEVILTLGVILALFVGYKALLQDSVIGSQQQALAQSYESQPSRFMEFNQVKLQGDVFAQLYVPRFGDSWTRLIGQGTRWHPTLNTIGVGHYIGTAWPGHKGNFAVAAHRGGFGGAFKEIHRLVEGDKVYVKTRHFWFTYRYLQSKIVDPTDTDVINDVPKELVGAKSGGRYMTMTTCTPIFVNTQRYIVWFELVGKSKAAPAEVQRHGGN